MLVNRPTRRSLTNVGGEVDLGGDPESAQALAHAMDVAPPPPKSDRTSEGEGRAHVHGFHSYPARMHPSTAARLVERWVPAGGTLLDPFCGSGTVLVEAIVLGRHARGCDLNPLAVELSRAKVRRREEGELDALVEAARAVAKHADARRKAKAGPTHRYDRADVEAFDPHVLLELDGLRDGIDTLAPEPLRRDLSLVLSAILVKVSRRESDTATRDAAKRIAAGYPAKLFVRKTEELAARLGELAATVPSPRPAAEVSLSDARQLDGVATASVDGVVTSPPYVATYDYLAHHDLRIRWMGLDASPLAAAELGARRHYSRLDADAAWNRWATELHRVFMAIARVTRPDAPVVLLMADSAVGETPLPADEIVAQVAAETPLVCVARASQIRPHFHRQTQDAFLSRPRAEHALLLRRGRS